MYVPTHFAETNTERLERVMREHPFGLLITHADDGIQASHLPVQFDPSRGPQGTLVAHMAKANPQWRSFGAEEVLTIFSGPHAYVSPRWYTTPVNVPTWNYVAVHAYGVPRILESPQECLQDLVEWFEADAEQPWSMDGLPRDYLDKLYTHVVAFEIPVTRLEGKQKLGQNRPPVDRRSAVAGLRAAGDPLSMQVAELMEQASA